MTHRVVTVGEVVNVGQVRLVAGTNVQAVCRVRPVFVAHLHARHGGHTVHADISYRYRSHVSYVYTRQKTHFNSKAAVPYAYAVCLLFAPVFVCTCMHIGFIQIMRIIELMQIQCVLSTRVFWAQVGRPSVGQLCYLHQEMDAGHGWSDKTFWVSYRRRRFCD